MPWCRVRRRLVFFLVKQNTARRAVEIFVLARSQRPEKGAEPEKPEEQCDRNEIDEHGHDGRTPRWSRKALAMTRIEELDMAIAAISGVTTPAIASGTARRL